MGTDEPAPDRPRRRRALTAVHWVALVLAGLVAILSVIAIWTRNQVVDTDRYVRTVAPLATEPPIQDLLVDSLTNAIADPERTAQFAQRLLPPRAEPLATPIAAAAESFVRERLGRFIRSDRFAELWRQVSLTTHDSAVRLITGSDQSKVQVVGDQLVVRLGPLLGPARQAIEQAGLKVPLRELPAGEEPQIVLGDASDLESVRGIVDLLQKLAWLLPALGLILLVVAAVTGPGLRRGILRAGLALAIAMVVLLLALLIGRSFYLDAVTSPRLPEAAARAAFDTLLHYMRVGIWIVLAAAVVIALGAFAAGFIARRRAPEPTAA